MDSLADQKKSMPANVQCNLVDESNTTKLNPLNGLGSDQQLDDNSNESVGQSTCQDESQALREPFPFAGFLGAILTSLAGAVAILCIKLLPVEKTVQEKAKACMIRGMFMMLYSSIGILYRGYSFKLPRDEYLINFMRTLFGSLGMILNYVALNFITIGESTAIIYASPVWTCVLSFIILREPLKFSMLVALPASLVGIIFLAKPDLLVDTYDELATELGLELASNQTLPSWNSSSPIGNETNSENVTLSEQETRRPFEKAELEYYESRLPGILAALTVSFLMAFIIIVLKYRKKTPIETCTFYLSIGTISVSAGMQWAIGFGAMPNTLYECALHFYIGTISYFTQFLFQWALQYVPAGIYSVARSADIMFAFLMGAIFLQELVPLTSIVGSILITFVVTILVMDELLVRGIKRILGIGSKTDGQIP